MTELYWITGFGIPGDEAFVEADSVDHARARLASYLQDESIDFTHTDAWTIEPASRPVLIVKWRQ
jgi:hypothetical protein